VLFVLLGLALLGILRRLDQRASEPAPMVANDPPPAVA